MRNVMDRWERHTSFQSVIGPALLDSSRSKLGVREIFLGSAVSSLKKESVFRTVPFLDLLTVGSTYRSKLDESFIMQSFPRAMSPYLWCQIFPRLTAGLLNLVVGVPDCVVFGPHLPAQSGFPFGPLVEEAPQRCLHWLRDHHPLRTQQSQFHRH